MTNTTKFYSNKQNAARAAKSAGLDINECNLTENNGTFAYIPKPAQVTTIQGLPYVRESSIHRPCAQVWHIADSMLGAKRKEVLAACIENGIAFYTARTQYQLWSQCQKEMQARQA